MEYLSIKQIPEMWGIKFEVPLKLAYTGMFFAGAVKLMMNVNVLRVENTARKNRI